MLAGVLKTFPGDLVIFYANICRQPWGFTAYHLRAMSRPASFPVPFPTFSLNVVFDLLLSPSFTKILMCNFNAEKKCVFFPLLPPASLLQHQ